MFSNFYYKVCGIEGHTFDTLKDARRYASVCLSKDEFTSQILGAGRKVVRINVFTGQVKYFSL